MPDEFMTEQDVHDLLAGIGADAEPAPAFKRQLQQRLYQELPAVSGNGRLIRPFDIVPRAMERQSDMKRKNILIPALAFAFVAVIAFALVWAIMRAEGSEILAGGSPPTATETPTSTPVPAFPQQNTTGGPTPVAALPQSDPVYVNDAFGLKASEVFGLLPGNIVYSYSAVAVDDAGMPVVEMRFWGDDYVIVLTEKPAGGLSLPPGEPVSEGTLSAIMNGGLAGTANLTGEQLQDGAERPVFDFVMEDDGRIGGMRDYPDKLRYEDGYRLTWIMGDFYYEMVSNLPLDTMLDYALLLPLLADGSLPAAAVENNAASTDPHYLSILIGAILAEDTYYATSFAEVDVNGSRAYEYRYYGDKMFFIVAYAAPGTLPAVEGEPYTIDEHDGVLARQLEGMITTQSPLIETFGGIGVGISGGGGGGGNGDGEQTIPSVVFYQGAYQFSWEMNGAAYTAFTNTSRVDLIAFVEHIIRVINGDI